MKKNNIFSFASLKLWLVLFSMIPVMQTLAQDLVSKTGFRGIKSDYFWYHNGGGGLYSNGFDQDEKNNDGYGYFYRYFPADLGGGLRAVTSETTVIINGDEFKTYTLQNGDAIGFKPETKKTDTNPNGRYRIKIYYREKVGDSYQYTPDGEVPNLLFCGNDAKSAKASDVPAEVRKTVTDIQVMVNDVPESSGTYMLTYEFPPNDGNKTYWIKNDRDKDLYLGGFEFSKIEESSAPEQECGSTWTVADAQGTVQNKLNKDGNGINIAKTHDNVVVTGATMPINSFEIGGDKTVMLNDQSRIGVYLPAGATLKFTFAADPGVGVKLYDDSDNELSTFTSQGGYMNVEYNTDTAQKIWITGASGLYVYFPGFTISVEQKEVTIADATAISSDYVWYPVKDKFFDAGVLTDSYTLNAGVALSSNGESVTMNAQSHQTYNVNGENIIGFKVDGTKTGLVNFFGAGWGMRLYSSLADAQSHQNARKLSTYSVDGVQVSTWYFNADENGDKEFWLATEGSDQRFGGFEVLFENPSVIDLAKAGKFDSGSLKKLLTNAISSDTYNAVQAYNAGVYGPTMMCYPISGNTVMLGIRDEVDEPVVRNAVVFRVSDATYTNVEISGYLRNDASIKLYKGDTNAPDRTQLCMEITGSGKVSGKYNITKDTPGQIYWVVSDKMAGVHLNTVSVNKEYTELQPIDTHYIYNVVDVPKAGIISGTDGHVKLVGDVTAGSSVTVLGQKNNSIVVGGGDYLGIKVGSSNGKNTGYIKVYLNGGNSDSHKMVELPLNQALNAGWSSSYAPETQTITFTAGGGGRGWWFGTGTDVRDLSTYNKLDIEVEVLEGNPNLQAVVQDVNGNRVVIPIDKHGRMLGSLPAKGAEGFDITNVSQIYIQDNNVDDTQSIVKIKSARLMNKPVSIATGTDENDDSAGYNEVFGGKIYDVQDAHVYCYPFNLENTADPQLYWISGDGINIAAIEVVYDDVKHAKVIEWYVNKDTKMIVGSDDPGWVWTDFSGNEVAYPDGYDEYVTFYVPAARPASVSFIMPEAVAEVYDWEQAIKTALKNGKIAKDKAGDVFDESKNTDDDDINAVINSYGRHTIETIEKENSNKIDVSTGTKTYDRNKGQNANMSTAKNDLYSWYTYSLDIPSNGKVKNSDFVYAVEVKGTQKENGKENNNIETVGGLPGQWRIYMRFVFLKSPVCTESNNNVTISTGHTGAGNVFYTTDSSDPENLDAGIDENRSFTSRYNGSFSVAGKNCIVKAAQYYQTPYQFYTDCSLGDSVSNVFKLVSADLAITNTKDNVVYVKDEDPTDVDDKELFNYQPGGYMLTLPTGKETMSVKGRKYSKDSKGNLSYVEVNDQYEQKYNANPWMYLTLGGKDWPYVSGTTENGPEFSICGTNWVASNDGGLKTYLDSYQYMMTFTDAKVQDNDNEHLTTSKWSGSENQNPYTEVNGGPGGSDTEEGGMFLQPIGGTMLRFEPEYDGVVTVWLRQNGCLDNNTQENGKFARRPVFIMDENGRLMRRSTVRPNDEHYLGINGTWAINSSVCEERSQVEHTWLHAVAKQAFANNPLYADRFGKDFPNRWEEDGLDHAGHIMYGWWYKGFSLDATRSSINTASHVSRFEYMEPELLYRSDKIFDMEMNTLGLNNGFAKYGYELPNFQYVRYRIPVKAGKTYYIAGRGTKNGFSAISFDPLKANTNGNTDEIATLRYKDNPAIVENSNSSSERYLKPESDWNKIGSSTGNASEADMIASYSDDKLKTVHIYENGNDNYEERIKPEIKYDMDNLGNLVGQTVNVQLHRTFTAGYWHPIILPFSVSETRLEQYFGEGTKVLYLDPYKHTLHNKTDNETNRSFASVLNPALENSKLYFTYHRYQMLYANTPAFICPTFAWSDAKKKPATDKVHPTPDGNGKVSDITFKRVTLDGSNSHNHKKGGVFGYDISTDYEVVGTYDETTEMGDVYYVTNTTGKAELIHSKGDNGQKVVMCGTRVWIRPKQTAVNPAPIRTVGAKDFTELDFDFDNDEAGINDIVNDDITVERYVGDSGVYDLLGRKIADGSLDGVPAGVYIFNGKKVYIN